MNWAFVSRVLSALVVCKCIRLTCSQRIDNTRIQKKIETQDDQRQIGCQQRSNSGRDYVGEANTTYTGIPCQRWSDKQPHDHSYTYVGDHNYCRNPYGANDHSHVCCFASDPKHLRQNCSVPFCPSLKAFEFGLDQNEDKCFTARHASIKKGNLPWSFTVCTAFKVEAWTKDFALYILSDDKGDDWHWLAILRSDRYTQFAF